MPRVKRGVTAHARHKKVLELAKGYRGRRKNVYRIAKEAVMKAGQYAYRDRRNKKREFRAPVDCPHQRGRPRSRDDLQQVHGGPEEGGHRDRPQGACRSRRAGQAGVQPDCRAGESRASAPESTLNREGGSSRAPFLFRPDRPMQSIDKIVSDAQGAFDAASQRSRPRAGEGALPRQVRRAHRAPQGPRASSRRRSAPKAGAAINEAKTRVEALVQARRDAILAAELDRRLAAEAIDVTLPGRRQSGGGLHPISRAQERIERLFRLDGLSAWPTGPRSRTTSTISRRCECSRTIRRGACRTRSTSRIRTRCCARRPRRCRSATCSRTRRPSGSSARGASTASTTMPPIRRCSTRSRGFGSTKASASRT